jgi:hypothetical protein
LQEKINAGGEHTVFEFFRYTAVGQRTCFTVPAMLAGLSGFGKPNKPVPLVWCAHSWFLATSFAEAMYRIAMKLAQSFHMLLSLWCRVQEFSV